MPGPFPGMDPYLERVGYWQEFHNSFIYLLKVAINGSLPERFIARSEMRVYIDKEPPQRPVPDVTVFAVARNLPRQETSSVATLARSIVAPEEVLLEERREAFIEILDRANGKQVVMVIELLSPENKRGEGREEYRRKQRAVLQSKAHLLEIDLLRGGQHTVSVPEDIERSRGDYAYLLSLADAQRPLSVFVWRIGLRDFLPTLCLPLTEDVEPFVLDMQAVFDRCYEEGLYAALLEEAYAGDPEPPLSPDDVAWVQECLTSANLR
ncbi:MAG: DUF4058 family protein [Armatimonas sp.]